MENKSIRIRTTPGVDKNIKIELNQDFDFIEILSLKISQQDIYETFCADYGVVIGRVIANEGFGVPNAKVSVFVPITDEDQKNELISALYPYKTVTSTNEQGIRYNLLLEKSTCNLNTAVGTFPTKETVLNNDIYLEIFDKYYKYTTVTNDAGDYIIFGVPTGQQTIHMDVDLSDIGFLSLRPYDLKSQGFPDSLFNGKNFKKSNNLDTLAQIKTQNKGVDVVPFWGDSEKCNFGITRVDFSIGNDLVANSIFMGSIFTDSNKNYIKKNCQIKKFIGDQGQLETGPGEVSILKLNFLPDQNNTSVDLPTSIENFGTREIDENGVYVFTLPLYYDKVITDEFGNLVRSIDQTKGVPTKGRYRFKLKFSDESSEYKGRKNVATASLIVPSANPDVRFTTEINSVSYKTQQLLQDFHLFEWKQVYTTTQYIRKFKPNNSGRFDFIGLKNCGMYRMYPNSDNDPNSGDSGEDEQGEGRNLDLPYVVAIKRNFGSLSRTKKIKLCFYNAWLNGGCYLYKFQVKGKRKGTNKCCGLFTKGDDFENMGEINWVNGLELPYWNNAKANGLGMPSLRCTFITPQSMSLVGGQNVKNGAIDTQEFVYCRYSLDTRIINIGSMLMCQEILDILNDSLSNTGSLKYFNGCNGGTYSGIITNPLTQLLPSTTYTDPNPLYPYHASGVINNYSDWGNALNIWGSDGFINSGYQEKELKTGPDGFGELLKYYCRIDYSDDTMEDSNGDPQQISQASVGNLLNYKYLDTSEINRYFCCSSDWTNMDIATSKDHPYFYFGIIPGSTALDKLRKDFF